MWQNQHVMLPEAAKKVRFLRSDFKRRMDEGGKTMTPDERQASQGLVCRKEAFGVCLRGQSRSLGSQARAWPVGR